MSGKVSARAVAAFLASFPLAATAQETVLDAVVITADRPDEAVAGASRLDRQALPALRAKTSDTARLLENIPGAATYGAGGI